MRATHRYDVTGLWNTGAWSHSTKVGSIGRCGTPRFSSAAERSEESIGCYFDFYDRVGRTPELVESLADLAVLVEPLLIVRRVVREQLGILHRRLLAIVRDDDVCRRLMTIPGVGPVVALTYRVTVDVPARFRNSKAVGAVFGLTPAKYQSGEIDRTGAISRCGDEVMRVEAHRRG